MKIPASQIRKGDRFSAPGYVVWTALADAVEVPDEGPEKPGMIVVEIQHHDGGRGTRAWSQGDTIDVVRDDG